MTRAFVTPSPRFEPEAFVSRIIEMVRENGVELILPAFEEALVLAEFAHLLPARLFTPPLESLRMLHEKHAFLDLARKLGLATPVTEVVHGQASLHEATKRFGLYFARPSNSRGGVELFTNTGPLAGVMSLEECHPTADAPWVVQPYVDGVDVCTFSVAHHGRLTAHVSYVHPRELEHAGGIVFESVHEPQAQAIAARVAEATHYDGQLSLDLRLTREGFVLIECNPRPTAGVLLLEDDEFERAVMDASPRTPVVAEAGRSRKITLALVRDMLVHWKEIPRDLPHLLSQARDVYAERGDRWPAMWQVLSYGQVLRLPRAERQRKRSRLKSAYFHDVAWDGAPGDAEA